MPNNLYDFVADCLDASDKFSLCIFLTLLANTLGTGLPQKRLTRTDRQQLWQLDLIPAGTVNVVNEDPNKRLPLKDSLLSKAIHFKSQEAVPPCENLKTDKESKPKKPAWFRFSKK